MTQRFFKNNFYFFFLKRKGSLAQRIPEKIFQPNACSPQNSELKKKLEK